MLDVIVAKQRNGPRDTIRLTFEKEFCRMGNYAPPMAWSNN